MKRVSQVKGVYEKVGEATETALTVLVEKMNPYAVDKSSMTKKDIGTACNQGIQSMWKKEFTLEFSRDRKSMSSFCVPVKQTKLGPGPKMFVKVRPAIAAHSQLISQLIAANTVRTNQSINQSKVS